jgi:predicted nucleotidyltransferase
MHDGIKEKYRKQIIQILSTNPRVKKVVLFGTRAIGGYSTASDVDLALFGEDLTLSDQADLADKIEQTTLPQQVDLVRFHRIKNPNLIEHIRQHGVEWYHRPD